MNNEIVNKFMTEMGDLLNKAKDFTIEQAPQVAKEVLAYNFWTDVVRVVALLAIYICLYLGHRKLKAYDKAKPYTDANIIYLPMGLVFIGSTAASINILAEMIKIQVAPRLYLIEYFASLVHHHG